MPSLARGVVTDRDGALVGFVAAHPWVVSEQARRFLSLQSCHGTRHVAAQVARRRLLVLLGYGLLAHGGLRLFGVPLSAYITEPAELLSRYGDISRWQIAAVAVPLTIVAGILTHLTAKHSVARQNPAQIAANPQAAMMNKMMVYLFPLGVVAGGPFFPLAILLYWLSNNLWTLAQQRVVYQRIDVEDEVKKQAAIVTRQALAPRPGQKPSRLKKDAASSSANLTDSDGSDSGDESVSPASTNRSPVSGPKDAGDPADGRSSGGPAEGASTASTNGQGAARPDSSAPPGMIKQRPRKKTNRKRR
jgi:YidC/Oxa1 family membrane protein insertase